MTLGRYDNQSASDVAAGLSPASPIRKSDVAAVRKNYGIAASFKPKGMSDTSLYGHSVKFVLDWWKKNHPATPAAKPVAKPAAKPAATGGIAPKPVAAKAPAAASAAVRQGNANRVNVMNSQLREGVAPKPVVQPMTAAKAREGGGAKLAPAQVNSILTQMGVRGVTPPASALVSATALRAWATAQKQKQSTSPAARQRTATANRLTGAGVL